MAKCTIDPLTGQILTISGQLGNTLFKTYRNGHVRAYLTPKGGYPRTKPVTKAELLQRKIFSVIASEVARRIKAGDTRPRKVIWAEVKTDTERMRNLCNCYAIPMQHVTVYE